MSEQTTFTSRWGFHPVDYETYLKLKRLKKFYWKAIYVAAQWDRWHRKEPQNRFYWEPRETQMDKRKRSDRPIPEPLCCPVSFQGVIEAFEESRMPKQSESEVKPIEISLTEIDAMLAAAEEWSNKA